MNDLLSHRSVCQHDVSLVGDLRAAHPAESPDSWQELVHDLRQPLGTIEALAYFLELTAQDDNSCPHLRRIRNLVAQANRILDRASTPVRAVAAAAAGSC